jgi:hypothetical protein
MGSARQPLLSSADSGGYLFDNRVSEAGQRFDGLPHCSIP